MPTRVPKSYDEITRATVPEPDGSWRPSDQQVRQASEGFRALDAREQALFDRVDSALAAGGEALDHVRIEVTHDCVTLRGHVRSPAAINRALEIVRTIKGVGAVLDRIVISPD